MLGPGPMETSGPYASRMSTRASASSGTTSIESASAAEPSVEPAAPAFDPPAASMTGSWCSGSASLAPAPPPPRPPPPIGASFVSPQAKASIATTSDNRRKAPKKFIARNLLRPQRAVEIVLSSAHGPDPCARAERNRVNQPLGRGDVVGNAGAHAGGKFELQVPVLEPAGIGHRVVIGQIGNAGQARNERGAPIGHDALRGQREHRL